MKAPEAEPLASVPDWMQKPAQDEPAPTVPDWMKAPEAEPLASVPDWMKGPAQTESSPPAPVMQPEVESSLPDWMKPWPTPEDETVAYEPGMATPPTPEPVSSAPDWMQPAPSTARDAPSAVPAVPDKPITDWLHPASSAEEQELRQALEAEKPDWLKQMEAESDAYEASLKPPPAKPAPDVGATLVVAPDWLRAPADQPSAPPPAGQPAMPAPPNAVAASEDSALAWLEALAVRQGAKQEEMVSDRSVSADDVPEWLRDSLPDVVGVPSQPQPGGEATSESAETALPDWLKTLSEEESTPPPETAATVTRPAPKPQRPRPPRPPKSKSAEAPEAALAAARENLETSDFGKAAGAYAEVIKSGVMLEEVIADLEAANENHPNTPEILRTLGDAYVRDNQLQRALDIYKQALQGL
ncbi:MAG: hypothetical protein AAB427_14085, partial [Chloroflexota bacterium]